uniref:Uncharacterized protein n=1 Tax=Romanomermis culicivorax TaxID=13658 RepID=A0A915JZJ7_ROMCU
MRYISILTASTSSMGNFANMADEAAKRVQEHINRLDDQIDGGFSCSGRHSPSPQHQFLSVVTNGGTCGEQGNAQAAVMNIMPATPNREDRCLSYNESFDKSSAYEYVPPEVKIMEPILRLFQLLCENHNHDLQNYLRHQNNRTNYNMIIETLTFLDIICGSTSGRLGLLQEINEYNVSLINQALESLTEYCQGPCHENQNCIATHESNGLNIVISLVLNEIRPLVTTNVDLALEIKGNASKTLLSTIESRHDSENANRILSNMESMAGKPQRLFSRYTNGNCRRESSDKLPSISVVVGETGSPNSDSDPSSVNPLVLKSCDTSPLEVGHNIYILAYQLAKHSSALADLLKSGNPVYAKNENTRKALNYYVQHTAQIEIVRTDHTLEEIVFPVPNICSYLSHETKERVYLSTERDVQGSKVTDFFDKFDLLYKEMVWQEKLRSRTWLHLCSQKDALWARTAFIFAFIINLLIALFYPFNESQKPHLQRETDLFLWLSTVLISLFTYSAPTWSAFTALCITITTRCSTLLGVQITVILLGILQTINKTMHVISYVGNTGITTYLWKEILVDRNLWYHLGYLCLCILGLCVHELFYSILLLDVVLCEETLRNVIRSVTRNWRSIALTTMLAVILVYLFSVIGYIFFKSDFVLDVERPPEEGSFSLTEMIGSEKTQSQTCNEENFSQRSHADTISGVVLRKVHPLEPMFLARTLYDLSFFFILIVIVLNLIFGVIIDTFADLRNEKQNKDDVLRNSCFICGLERSQFDNKTVSYDFHIKNEHNMWHYLYFYVLLRVKKSTEFTGPESFVKNMISEGNLEWFPRMQAISLATKLKGDGEAKQNGLKTLEIRLDENKNQIKDLNEKFEEVRQLLLKNARLR